MKQTDVEILIIGSGPAGLTAGIYAARAGHNPIILAGTEFGGQCATIPTLGNYPGVNSDISGLDLIETMRAQNEKFGVKIVMESAASITPSGDKYIVAAGNETFNASAIIIATGAYARHAGIAGEEFFAGRGVSYCAVCDGFFYREKSVAVVGGGNAALVDALYLAKLSAKVVIIYRGESFVRAQKSLVDKVMTNPNISVRFQSVVSEIVGNESGVQAALIGDDKIAVDGVFIAVGHDPATDFVRDILPRDAGGFIQTTPGKTATTRAGIFAAGDVAADHPRQVATAVGMGATAAVEAHDYLTGAVQ